MGTGKNRYWNHEVSSWHFKKNEKDAEEENETLYKFLVWQVMYSSSVNYVYYAIIDRKKDDIDMMI